MLDVKDLIIGKSDKRIVVELKDSAGQPVNFSAVDEIEVVLAVNRIAVQTYTKTDNTVSAVSGEDAQCKILVTAEQQINWATTGLLQMQFTTSQSDDDFPNGREKSALANLYYLKKAF